jgi:hypothetical protein
MNDRPGARIERRRHLRIAPKGTVVLAAGEHAQRGRIANLAQGGMLVGTSVMAPARLLGRDVDVKLRLDGQLACWLQASGRIIRIGAEGIAIAFESMPPDLARLIDEMSTESSARLRVISVVLIDADTSRRATMAAGFDAVGCLVIAVATPLEAIVRLGEASFEPDLIAIADSVPSTAAEEMRRFVERDHPRVKLVTIGHESIEPSGIANWLSSEDPRLDLPARVRDVLGRPRRPNR